MLENSSKILKTLPKIIELALQEDEAFNDITSDLTIRKNINCNFAINAREELIFCGKKVIEEVFLQLKNSSKFQNSALDLNYFFEDGDAVKPRESIISGVGDVKIILSAERTILNLIQHLSAIATSTRKHVKKLNNPKIKILDTRKTLPNMRELQKYAVKCGGGENHRFSLADLILIKDNHISACGGISEALEKVSDNKNNLKIEIECDNYSQVVECLKFNPNIIMLDNMNLQELQKSIEEIRKFSKNITIEISGGINLENIQNYRNFDIDFISIGTLTNSAKIVDIGLDFI
jgi:nicotinate-nucleotide pyrophosphorylase (carboxylating)